MGREQGRNTYVSTHENVSTKSNRNSNSDESSFDNSTSVKTMNNINIAYGKERDKENVPQEQDSLSAYDKLSKDLSLTKSFSRR